MSDYDGVSDGKLLDTETDGSTVSTASNPGVSPAKIRCCIFKDGGGSHWEALQRTGARVQGGARLSQMPAGVWAW